MGKGQLELAVPCGSAHALHNGEKIPFHVSRRKYDIDGIYIPVDCLEVDLSECAVGDKLLVGIEGCWLRYSDSDERSVLLAAEGEDCILGICGYEPQYHGDFEALRHCYELDGLDEGCLRYIVLRDPSLYDVDSGWAKRIPIAACSIDKQFYNESLSDRFDDIETAIFLAATAFVG